MVHLKRMWIREEKIMSQSQSNKTCNLRVFLKLFNPVYFHRWGFLFWWIQKVILSLYSQKRNTMTNQELFSTVSNKFEREFDASETMRVLTYNQMMYFSWGVSKKYNVNNKGLLLKVSGHHHKGWVLITLSWNDTYSVYIVSNKGEVKDEYKEVFFDELVELIDDRIERVEEYVR